MDKSKRDGSGRLMPGHGMGRPRGSISESTALRDRLIRTVAKLDDEVKFPEYGGNYILWFGKNFPEKFMALVASLLPKQLKIDSEHTHKHVAIMDLPESERARIFQECRSRVLKIRGVEVVDEGKP